VEKEPSTLSAKELLQQLLGLSATAFDVDSLQDCDNVLQEKLSIVSSPLWSLARDVISGLCIEKLEDL